MIAEPLLKNDRIKLTEFYGSRGRLEDGGLEALSKFFTKNKSI